MRSEKYKSLILITLWVFSLMSTYFIASSEGQPSVPFEVHRTVWGTDPDSPTKAYPGDTERPLTVEVQNLSPDKTIKGVSAILLLGDGPFTDVYGNHNATATGEPTVGELLNPTDEIKPKGFFTLTFTLDIDSEAVPGSYEYDMVVNYSVQSGGGFVEGEPQTLTVRIVLSKIGSTVTVSISPQTVEIGEAVMVSGSLTPAEENVSIDLTFKKPNGSTFNSTVKTKIDGTFTMSYRPDLDGSWNANASWVGDERYEASWASASFEVRLPTHLTTVISNNRLTGGLDNNINITIINNGEVPISALDVTLAVPSQSPLVIIGDNHWTFNYLAPKETASIMAKVFAPEAYIGATYSGTLSLNYRNDYGESLSETIPVGFIVVGRIELVLYGETYSPYPARNGSRITLTATLLNKGNAPAMYVNASILPNPVLELTSESKVYIGDIDKNSQSPFTLIANVPSDLGNGTYPLTIGISYRDDQYIDHYLAHTIYFTVEATEQSKSTATNVGVQLPIPEEWLVLLVTLAAVAVIIYLYRRTLRRTREK